MPNFEGVDARTAEQLLRMEMAVREWEQNQKAQAMRWQGSRDYQTLIDSGVDPMEALRRSAPKLFFNDPSGLASAARAVSRPEGRVVEINGEQFVNNAGRLTHIPSPKPKPQSNIEEIGGETYIRTDGRLVHVPKQRTSRDTSQMIDVTTKGPMGETIRQRFSRPEYEQRQQYQQQLDAAQAAFDQAKQTAEGRWFGPRAGDIEAMNTTSNALRNIQMQGMPAPPMQQGMTPPPTQAMPTPAAPVTTPAQQTVDEVIGTIKSGPNKGRRAIFNRATKQFIRFEDEQRPPTTSEVERPMWMNPGYRPVQMAGIRG